MFIKTPPTFVEVLLGDSLTLSCGAHGNPRPTVVWHKDESPIEKHEKIKVRKIADGALRMLMRCLKMFYMFYTALLVASSVTAPLVSYFRCSMVRCLWPPSQEIYRESTNVMSPIQKGILPTLCSCRSKVSVKLSVFGEENE